MFINLLIASAFVLTTLIVVINFNRIFETAERLNIYMNKCKSFIGMLIHVYKNRGQISP